MPLTTRLEIDDQTNGSNNNTWGDVTDDNLRILEQAIAGVTSIATTGGTTTLTSSQNRFPIIVITGTLVSNATINVRAAEKNWQFINATSGAFTVTVKTPSGSGQVLPRGQGVTLYCDGTNVLAVFTVLARTATSVGGAANAVTLTFSPAFSGFVDGMEVSFRATAANTGAMTIQCDLLAAKNFQMDASGTLAATFSGAVQPGMAITAKYNLAADVFVWLNQKPLIFNTNGNVQAPAYNIGSLSNCFISPNIGGYPGINFDTSDFIAYARTLDVMLFNVAGSERFRITSSGFGYATSGASVTQSTNKVTGVTINAASGLITMNVASLANGASARFQVNNNLVSSSDVVVANFNASLAAVDQNYRLSLSVGAGAFVITVTNQSGGALAEAVPINFALIKAVNA